jgi:hypothetical protein
MGQIIDFYITHPWIGFVGTVASVVSLFLGVYFFLVSQRYPDVTIATEPARIRIVVAGQTSGIRVYAGGDEVTSDVTAVQVSVWNRGTAPIRDGDVLEPIELSLEPPVPILEVQVTRASRPACGLVWDAGRQAEGVLPLKFKILEPGDGVTLQLIYAGPTDVAVGARGAVVGQKAVSVAWRPRVSIPEQRPTRGSFIEMTLLFAALAGATLVAGIRFSGNLAYPGWQRIGGSLFLAALAWFFAHVAVDALRNAVRMTRPPF